MKKIRYISSLCGLLLCAACAELDIPPKNIVTDDDLLASTTGMDIYMARMYSQMPFEDFKYMGEWGFRNNSWLGAMGIDGTGEAVNRDGITRAFTGEAEAYWNNGNGDAAKPFRLLRDANYLIETLPKYKDAFQEATYNHYIGEAYFVRAMVFSAMARRFGGVPLVTKLIPYPAEMSTLEVPRSSEEQTWDQVRDDFDEAIKLLGATSLKDGYANRYVALTYKSEAMLYAGSVAKYNETMEPPLTGFGTKTGVRVIGFEDGEAASVKYFKESYLAAREVMSSNRYSLYKKAWAANNPEAQYQNMVDMFSDLSSPENIYVRKYLYPTMTHGYDAYSAPWTFKGPLSGGTCPTLDFIELFDGFDGSGRERYPDGSIRVTDGTSNTDGSYLMFDTPMDFFKDAEPRLRAYVIFPGDVFRGKVIEIRAGVHTGDTPIKPLLPSYSYAARESNHYQSLSIVTAKPATLFLSRNDEEGGHVLVPFDVNNDGVEDAGETITASGSDGPFYGITGSAITGFYGRKWLNPNPAFQPGEGLSAQPFILMRYADVLLNAAEAAMELALAGEPAPDGADLMEVAKENINAIQERAGAKLTPSLAPDKDGRNVVRKERRKELAFEHKTKWDLRRWRVLHYDGRDGFWGEERSKDAFSGDANYCFRGLYPFFSTKARKYFFDARFQWISQKTFRYTAVDYYFEVPSGEVTKSPVIDQQPNR